MSLIIRLLQREERRYSLKEGVETYPLTPTSSRHDSLKEKGKKNHLHRVYSDNPWYKPSKQNRSFFNEEGPVLQAAQEFGDQASVRKHG
jgi:hypothetical protein